MGTGNEETTPDLNQVMEAGMEAFQGELEEAARDESAESGEKSAETITPKPAEETGPPKNQGTEEGDPAPDDDSAATEDPDPDSSAAGTDEQDTPEEKKQFRFKSHEEAESGYRHLQSKATRAEAEAARLREELQKKNDAEAVKERQAENDKDLLEFMTEAHEKALDAIDELNPEEEGYRKRVARIWAEKETAVEVKKRELYEDKETASAGTDADTGVPERDWAVVEEMARDNGIDPEDEYFLMICTHAPRENPDGTGLSYEEQVDWAVRQTKTYHKKQERQFQERQTRAAKKKSETHQEENLPLGRSPADRKALAPDKIPEVTLNDALESALEERRL